MICLTKGTSSEYLPAPEVARIWFTFFRGEPCDAPATSTGTHLSLQSRLAVILLLSDLVRT